jgi:carbamoyl-phosphate synthase large subunit
MNVLITSASRKASLVKAFQQALTEEGGGKVVAVDTSPLSPALYLADEHFLVPHSQKPGFLGTILQLCEQLDIKLVIPTRDEELPFFAEHKGKFAKIGVFVMVSEPATLEICQDKMLFVEFCKENGFATPKRYESANLSDRIIFPLFVKPRRGKGGRGILCVNSIEELDSALKQVPGAIIQEFIKAPEYTIDLFSDFSGKVISVIPRERIRTFGGESFVGKTVSSSVLFREAARLATKLGLIGHNTIQCFLENDAVKFIEVNPRFGGGAHLGFAAGAPTPLFLVKLLKGEILKPRIGKFKDNYFMLRYTEDMFFDLELLEYRVFK